MRGGATIYQRTVIGGLILLHAATASAQAPPIEARPNAPSPPADQVIYKGVVGNLLETVALDPEDRVQLQRANAVLANPLSARSVAVALGLASPPLMLLGFIWGLFSAAKIKPAEPAAERPGALPNALRASVPSHGIDERYARLWFYTPADDKDPADRLPPAQLRMPRFAAASELAAVAGTSGRADPGVPCDSCYKQMLDWRAIPIPQ